MLNATKDANQLTITVVGTFNFGCYEEFYRAIGEAPAPKYIVDLRQVDYIDSAALGMLLVLRERSHDDPSRVTLRVGTGQPRDVLRLANFSSLFTIV